ncbi:DUF6777 domain-containing protein [Actinacidiphila sp. bgisy167]|uniref:DUF6777 domain-containing protein n=1 Tax=Actinacidiphila sp. bgisy167 TaxID=3413797 RepID=UPI003D729D75
MSVLPPSFVRPGGPPAGPLTGPDTTGGRGGSGTREAGSAGPDRTGRRRRTPTVVVGAPPPGEPPDGGGGGGGGDGNGGDGGGHQDPWWRSVPKVAAITAAVVAAVALAVVFTRPGGVSGGSRGELFLQSAGSAGPDPFTRSTAETTTAPSATPALPSPSAAGGTVRQVYNGGTPGLYGGTRGAADCDVERQISALSTDPSKNKAFARVLGLTPSGVPAYLRALTPLQLRADTRVTNHGYRGGRPTAFQAVLQAGTAVLVDHRGLPRVRCACGNPLTRPVEQKGAVTTVGTAWPGYQPSRTVVVAPAPKPLEEFAVRDPDTGAWFTRTSGDGTAGGDRPTTPPGGAPSGSPPAPPRGGGSPAAPEEGGGPDRPATPTGERGGTAPPSPPSGTGPAPSGPGTGTPGPPGEQSPPPGGTEPGPPGGPTAGR